MDTRTGAFSSYSLDPGTYVLNVSASDSRYTTYGIIEVKVVSITDEMMSEAVAVSIEKITPEDFVSLHRKSFERALTTISSEFKYATYIHYSIADVFNIVCPIADVFNINCPIADVFNINCPIADVFNINCPITDVFNIDCPIADVFNINCLIADVFNIYCPIADIICIV